MINCFNKTYVLSVCGFLLVLLEMASPLAGSEQTDLPYRAVVIGEDAVVRSGPGKSHYGTDRLRPGTEVQVFRHDPGGWMAIRPPERSFSMVQRDEIELTEEGLATVIHSDTVAWVGTRLNQVDKPLWQVRLRQGEALRVLGMVDRQKYELENKDPDWVQIEPPAGEFRWIAASDIKAVVAEQAEDSPTTGTIADDDGFSFPIEANPTTNQTGSVPRSTGGYSAGSPIAQVPFDSWESTQVSGEWTLETEPDPSQPSTSLNNVNTTTEALTTQGWKPARQPIANFVNDGSRFVAEEQTSSSFNVGSVDDAYAMDSGTRSGIFDQSGSPANYLVSQASTQGAALLTPTFGSPVIQSLEMRLTQEMLKPPALWNLLPLAAEAEWARSTATTQQDVNSINRMVEKIRSCREIKAGFRATGNYPNPAMIQAPVNLQAMQNPGPGPANAQNNLLYNYDAYGILNELVRDGGTSAPTFVLQDESGRITHHIAAPPGVNLRRYLNQRVGIIGNRGFHQQLQLNHVTAERIIAVDTLRR